MHAELWATMDDGTTYYLQQPHAHGGNVTVKAIKSLQSQGVLSFISRCNHLGCSWGRLHCSLSTTFRHVMTSRLVMCHHPAQVQWSSFPRDIGDPESSY